MISVYLLLDCPREKKDRAAREHFAAQHYIPHLQRQPHILHFRRQHHIPYIRRWRRNRRLCGSV